MPLKCIRRTLVKFCASKENTIMNDFRFVKTDIGGPQSQTRLPKPHFLMENFSEEKMQSNARGDWEHIGFYWEHPAELH